MGDSLFWFILPAAFVFSAAMIAQNICEWWDNRLVKAPKCCICGNINWKWTKLMSKSGSSPLCSNSCYGEAFRY